MLEQFLRMLVPDLQIWIKERDPKTASESAALADVFLSEEEPSMDLQPVAGVQRIKKSSKDVSVRDQVHK